MIPKKIERTILILVNLFIPVFLYAYFVKSPSMQSNEVKFEKILWYGVPNKISLSGDFRFSRTDKEGQKIGEHWFWAIPQDLHSKSKIDELVRILAENPTDVYQIKGLREEDDCDYYGPGSLRGLCVASIILTELTNVGR